MYIVSESRPLHQNKPNGFTCLLRSGAEIILFEHGLEHEFMKWKKLHFYHFHKFADLRQNINSRKKVPALPYEFDTEQ